MTGTARRPEIERCAVHHLFHHEEGAGLADAGQRDQLAAVQPVEISHVAHPYLEEIIEIAGDQMAVEDERQFADGGFKRGEALRR